MNTKWSALLQNNKEQTNNKKYRDDQFKIGRPVRKFEEERSVANEKQIFI